MINCPGRTCCCSALIILTAALFSSCGEDELKQAKTISSKAVEATVERTYGVEMIYSDSANVKAKIDAPLMLHYQVADPYYEMPKGVTVIFYDEKHEEENRVRANYATMKDNEKVTELRDNVVITTKAGDTYKSDQMFWNQITRKFYSSKLLTRISKKGEIGYASSFESDENFQHPVFHGTSGDILVPSDSAP